MLVFSKSDPQTGAKGIRFEPAIETQLRDGNKLWRRPREAREAGAQIGALIAAEYYPDITAGGVFEAAASLVDYMAIPEARRVQLMRGVVAAIEQHPGYDGATGER